MKNSLDENIAICVQQIRWNQQILTTDQGVRINDDNNSKAGEEDLPT
jgi:hypothetical protein